MRIYHGHPHHPHKYWRYKLELGTENMIDILRVKEVAPMLLLEGRTKSFSRLVRKSWESWHHCNKPWRRDSVAFFLGQD